MRLHLIDAAQGDCLLLEDDGPPHRFALIDGGPRGTFANRLQPYLAQVLEPGDGLDAVIVSHVDADHIAGVLDLLADVERARVDGETALAIADIWHNSFATTIDDAKGSLQRNLQSMMMAAGRAQFAAAQTGVGMLGIKQGVSVRRLATKLGIALNGFFGGTALTQEAQAGKTWQFGATAFGVVGPTAANLDALRQDWRAWVEAHLAEFEVGDRDAMAKADDSVPNLSSIVLLGESAHGDVLLTGDARGDHVLQGLEQSGKLNSDGIRPLRLLKLQHHGSIRNVDRDFFERLPAEIYAISANGKDGNPDLETLLLLVDVAREQGRNPLIVVTNEAPSVKALRVQRPPAPFGYRLAVRGEGDHAIVIDLALAPAQNPVTISRVPRLGVPDQTNPLIESIDAAIDVAIPDEEPSPSAVPDFAWPPEDVFKVSPRGTVFHGDVRGLTRRDFGGVGGEQAAPPLDTPVRGGEAAMAAAPAMIGVDAPAEAAPAPAVAAEVERFLAAEMQPNPRLGVPANLYVTVSPDPIVVADHAAAAALDKPVTLAADRPLTVEVTGTKNCEVLAPRVQQVDPADPDELVLKFRVRGQAAGAAEVLVEARQNNAALATFTLAPVFVDANPAPLRAQATLAPASRVRPGRVVLRIYEFVDGDGSRLLFNLTSDDPEFAELEKRELDPRFSLRDYTTAVLADVEKAWNLRQAGDRKTIYESFLNRLRAAATIRTRDLVPDKIRRQLWKHRDRIEAIQVISAEPYIPWELMYLTDPDGETKGGRFFAEWGLTRWLHDAPLNRRRTPPGEGAISYVIPDYANPALALKGAADERTMLKDTFGAAVAPVDASSAAVQAFLAEGARDCAVVHFACHGAAKQETTLEADLRMLDLVDAAGAAVPDTLTWQEVATSVDFGPDSGPLVFLNACQTGRGGGGISGVAGFASAFLRPETRRGAAAFIGALWAVDDVLATDFARVVYAGLKAGDPLGKAVAAARNACQTGFDFTWLAYTVYGD